MTKVPPMVRAAAYREVAKAKGNGTLVVPARCVECPPPEAHHPRGYDPDHALDVEWLCVFHHAVRHAPAREPVMTASYRDFLINFHMNGLARLQEDTT